MRVGGSDSTRHTYFQTLHTTLNYITNSEANRLDAFHWKQLCCFIGVFYPNHISNTALYNHCQAELISAIAQHACWQLFGHILRLPASAPANKGMTAYYSKPGVGRPDKEDQELYFPLYQTKTSSVSINYQLKTYTDFEAREPRHGRDKGGEIGIGRT